MSERWIANTANKQPVEDDVKVDVMFTGGQVYRGAKASDWGIAGAEWCDDDWWSNPIDPINKIIAWRLHNEN